MHYQITSDNIDMSPSMHSLVKEKAVGLENRLVQVPEGSRSIRAVLNKAPEDRFEVKILLSVRGHEYFAENIDYSLEHAIIKAVSEVTRMLEKDMSENERWNEVREDKWKLAEELLKEDPADL